MVRQLNRHILLALLTLLSNSLNTTTSTQYQTDTKDIYIRLGVYAVILNDNNEILLTKTQSGTRLIYNFPGGGVDSGESFAAGLQRECLEELGSDITIREHMYSSKQLYPHADFPYSRMFNLYYSVTLNEPDKIAALDCEEIAWLKRDELPLQDMLDIDKEFITFFNANIP